MSASLVGSEMCIRDRKDRTAAPAAPKKKAAEKEAKRANCAEARAPAKTCLLYTSDAADDM
eukprot:2951720-Alexandrium_andersonii.AAC.1